jgi:phosphatidate cytidylyltransferase
MALSDSLKSRLTTAAVAIPIALFVLYLGRPLFDAVVIGAALLMMREWDAMIQGAELALIKAGDFASLASVLLLTVLASHGFSGQSLVVFLLSMIAVKLIRKRLGKWHAVGVAYVAIPIMATFAVLEQLDMAGITWLLLSIWAIDSMAFLFGKTIGGPKIAPSISPNKTWAGLAGAVVGGAMTGALFELVLPLDLGMPLAVLGAVLAVVAQAGDFLESWVKRKFNVKDSSSILPGHGGLLDRMDGFLSAVTALALYIWVIQ